MRQRALVLGGVADVLVPPRRLGIDTVFFQRKEGLTPVVRALAGECHPVSFDDHEAMVEKAEWLHKRAPFDCVVSFSEMAMVPAALIAEHLGLPGASSVETARLLRDKLRMREKLNAAGLSPVRSALVTSLAAAEDFASAAGYPVIIKPRSGTGSKGVQRVDSPAGLPGAVAGALAAGGDGYVVEEFLDGPEFSLEAFSFRGCHRLIAITAKQVTGGYVESGHVIPAAVTPAQHAAIAGLLAAFLDLVGVTDGPSHTEVILDGGTPRVVESHDRLGGDKIFRLVELAYRVSLVSWCYEWPLGMMATPEPPPLAGGACIRFLLPPPGRVRRTDVPGWVHDDPHLDHLEVGVVAGGQVRPLGCSLDRAGFVVATGHDAAAAAAAAQRLAAGITIATEPLPGTR